MFLCACVHKNPGIKEFGEAGFRITYNVGRVLTEAEEDSLLQAKPLYYETSRSNKVYDFLVQRNIVYNRKLDTSVLHLKPINFQSPHLDLSKIQFQLETNIKAGFQFLHVRKGSDTATLNLGESLLGDRWISLFDINNDGEDEIVMLEKYYIIGGDNFDLKIYSF